jgi:hypothetical protein
LPKLPELGAFDRKLRAASASAGRPFLCEGSPFGCEIFLVGINPGTDTPFWPFWSVANGCDKPSWLKTYLDRHGRLGPTRERIERLFKAARPTRVLETNIFHRASKREAALPRTHQTTTVFDFLLKTLHPRVMFVHGGSAIKHLERLTNCSLPLSEFTTVQYQGYKFDVIAGHHLAYQWSYLAVNQLGYALKERCATSRRILR